VFSPVGLLIQKLYLASDDAFEKALCIAPQTRYLHGGVQIWEVMWPLFLPSHLQTVRVRTLLSDTCCVHRESPMHLAESAAPSDSSRL